MAPQTDSRCGVVSTSRGFVDQFVSPSDRGGSTKNNENELSYRGWAKIEKNKKHEVILRTAGRGSINCD